jgi:K+-sensing histidine kinase KdpD
VRAVAESLGGSVELTDNEAGGARFVVRLPAAEPAERAERAAHPAPAALSGGAPTEEH